MTQHSIEELTRQRNDAKSRHTQTGLDLALAEKRLHDTMCRASGLMGATATNTKGDCILIHDVEFSRGMPWHVRGFAFKKDGKVGFSERTFYLNSDVTIQGGRA